MNSNPGLPIVAPEDVGLSATRLYRINRVMQRYIDEGKLVSIVTMVCRQGKIAHFYCFRNTRQKSTHNTRYDLSDLFNDQTDHNCRGHDAL